jgi:cytochrome c oxidase subunit IV
MSEHIVSRTVYFVIFGALMILTLVTVLVARVDLGPANTIVALAVAVTKAVLVVLYFMHVRYSSRLTWVVVAGGFLWLAMMILITLSDYMTRGWSDLPGGR